MRNFIALLFLSLLLSCSSTGSRFSKLSLAKAMEGEHRSEDFKKRDQYRHPKETLEFFGIRPEMTVVEIWPSGGWYTQILAPYLAAQGQYIIADPPTDPRGYTKKRKEWMSKHPEIAKHVKYSKFLPPEELNIAPSNSVDMVLTFRNVHNWKPDSAQEAAFQSFYHALKPGGILGVVEHRAPESTKEDRTSGYVQESRVIKMAVKAGFNLAAKSEINANPKDSANHPKGVWTLPPSLRLGEKDKSKYLVIGESDRMTLKFVKPLK